jgi:uncharacterized protein YukE
MPELAADPDAIAADGGTVLDAADQLSGLAGRLRARDFGGSTVEPAARGHADLVERWRTGAEELSAAVESLGQALRGAAELYRATEDANVRRR